MSIKHTFEENDSVMQVKAAVCL